VKRSEYQPERKNKYESTVFIPRYQENGNIRDESGNGRGAFKLLMDFGQFREKAGRLDR
jgi:hypothetical protein